jgi:hypothetical protein
MLLADRDLLKSRSNEELFRRWLADHPGHTEVPERVKQNLANLKSHLRKQLKIRKHRRARKAAAAAEAAAPVVANAAPAKVSRRALTGLELLEERIDECLASAKTMDREGLDPVIKLLRRARNEVVWKTMHKAP